MRHRLQGFHAPATRIKSKTPTTVVPATCSEVVIGDARGLYETQPPPDLNDERHYTLLSPDELEKLAVGYLEQQGDGGDRIFDKIIPKSEEFQAQGVDISSTEGWHTAVNILRLERLRRQKEAKRLEEAKRQEVERQNEAKRKEREHTQYRKQQAVQERKRVHYRQRRYRRHLRKAQASEYATGFHVYYEPKGN